MVIIISGSVGTGKTIIAKALAKKLNYKYVDVDKIVKKEKIAEAYDKKRKCWIVDTSKLNRVLIKLIKEEKNLVIDSHLSHYLPKKFVDLCVILKCDIKELKKRLKRKGYSEGKIRENLDVEIFDVCLVEAKEIGHKILVVDTTKKKVVNVVKEIVNETKKFK